MKNKQVTCFTNSEEDQVHLSAVMPFMLETRLKEHGAEFKAAANWQPNAVECDRVVTGQNPASASPMSKKIVEILSKK